VQRQRSRSLPVAVERSSREADENFASRASRFKVGREGREESFSSRFRATIASPANREVSTRDALFMQLRSRVPSPVISGSGSRGPLVFGSRGSLGHGGLCRARRPTVASVLGIFRSGKFIRGIIFGEGKSSKRQTDV